MRLQKYINNNLNESYMVKDWLEVVDKLKQDCKPFIREKKKGKWLYRGIKKSMPPVDIVKPRKNRKPRDMPEDLHDELDYKFKEEFGWKSRSEGVFCTSNMTDAGYYGEPFIIYPIGKFKYVWSKQISDLYMYLKRNGIIQEVLYQTPTSNKLEQIAKDIVDLYQEHNLDDAMDEESEVSILCDSYYALDMWFLEPLDADKDYSNTILSI